MNPFEFYRAFAKLTPDKLRELAISAVHQNSETVIQDAKVANAEGLTFAGNQIATIHRLEIGKKADNFTIT